MKEPIQHRVMIALAAITILAIGIFLGRYLAENADSVLFESIQVGLIFTIIILVLIIGSLILEVKESLGSKKR